MTHFRLRWQKLGGHVHVGVWSGTEQATTHGCNGRLTFREDEWADFVDALRYDDGRLPDAVIELIDESSEVTR